MIFWMLIAVRLILALKIEADGRCWVLLGFGLLLASEQTRKLSERLLSQCVPSNLKTSLDIPSSFERQHSKRER